MKAETIAIRIADFLKDYPPFKFLQKDDLVDLASGGRVKFHEADEIIFSQGHPRNQFIHVVQQGRVKILESTPKGEKLIDLRGRGDLLGLQGVFNEDPYVHTGQTEMETILYALPRKKFTDLIDQSVEARRYLAAYFSLNPAYHWSEHGDGSTSVKGSDHPITLRKGGLLEVGPPQSIAKDHLVTATADCSIREIAGMLRSKRIDCVAIVDKNGHPLGKVTDAVLRDRIAEGASLGGTAADWMQHSLGTAPPEDSTGQLLLKLAQGERQFLLVTENGGTDSRVVGIVSERNLFLQYGRFPTVVGEAIAYAPDIRTLRTLRDRMESLILEFIENRGTLKWLMEMTGVLNRKMTQRIIELAQQEMHSAGMTPPELDFTWLMMGSGGRDELLIRSAVYHALVYADPDKSQVESAELYFNEMAKRVSNGLRQCGFHESVQGVLAKNPGWCLPLSAMKERFRKFIEEPSSTHVYSARDAFDFRSLTTDCPIATALRNTIRETIGANPNFIRYMASDSLLNQPPRTIFQGYVVDNMGIQREELALKFHALLPLVDVGRVLALESEDLDTTTTWQRLERAAENLRNSDPATADVLHEAAEAFLVAQYARISRGLRAGTDGAVIRASDLDAETRALLVTAFRAILNTLEWMASRYGLTLRS
ncbi:MAG: cyclic nucleotide-binding domain-containing protein [Opitutales bacterium]|nr:cyclic nucleotide-binding domain-containing protein [Opitutales bacterium]